MEIHRHNIFDLIGGRQNLYHSAILTSYTFDPIFFESFYLPRLRQCGISNVIVLLDASNYDQILMPYPSFGIQSDRRQYTLIRQTPSNNGVFHPKISMLFGEDAGLLIIGSGNLTYSGHALNEEVWNTFSLKGAESVYRPLFGATWRYLNALNLPDSILLKQQLKWIEANAEWLSDENTRNDDNVTIGHEQFIFLSNDSDGTILSKLKEIIGNERVESVTTIAPFYDSSGRTVKALYDTFLPNQMKCVYSEIGIYPYDLMKSKPDWLTLYPWDDVFTSKRLDVHKLHAKIIQFSLPTRTVIVSGSANVTNAAFNGIGDEACIVIISESPIDYIKKLGIILDRHSVATPAKLEILPKPERISSELVPKKLQIISAEVVDDTLSVITSHSFLENYSLRILNIKGDLLQEYRNLPNDNKLQIKDFTHPSSMVVFSSADGMEISNRCFVISEDDVARFNPNKALRKLDSLLESNKEWKDNLAGILSYLWFDNNSENSESNTKAKTYSVKKDIVGKSVSSEDFDNIHFGSRQSILSLPDVRIIDFLLSSDRKQKEDEMQDISDDADALQNVDSGDNEYYNCEHKLDQQKRDKAFIECIDNYSRLLRKHYDIRMAGLYSKANNFGADIFRMEYNDCADNVSVMDFSRILIDIVLMWQALSQDFDRRHGNIRQDFIRNLSKFLLLARKGYAKTNDYAWHKCVEFHKELIIFSLLIIACQDWRGIEFRITKLLIANLLNTLEESVFDINEIISLLFKKIEESNVSVKETSMALIDKTISEYMDFCGHKDDYSTIRDIDFDNPNGNYSYRNGYGFFYVTDINSIRQGANIVHEMFLYHPGFDDIIKVLGGRKIRPLC